MHKPLLAPGFQGTGRLFVCTERCSVSAQCTLSALPVMTITIVDSHCHNSVIFLPSLLEIMGWYHKKGWRLSPSHIPPIFPHCVWPWAGDRPSLIHFLISPVEMTPPENIRKSTAQRKHSKIRVTAIINLALALTRWEFKKHFYLGSYLLNAQ